MYSNKGFWIIGIIAVVLFGLLIIISFKASQDCEENGGEMVEAGTSTYFIQSGNMMIPMNTTNYECSVE